MESSSSQELPPRTPLLCRHAHALVQEFGRKVRAVFPDKRVQLRVNRERLEYVLVPQRLKDGTVQLIAKVHFPCYAVVELHPNDVVADVAGINDSIQHRLTPEARSCLNDPQKSAQLWHR